MLDVCNDSDDPFHCIKDALLGQFGKSKWQSYFELLHLPHGNAGPHAQRSHGEAKITSFSWCFSWHWSLSGHVLVHRLPSMCEMVGASIHMTAPAMVKALPTPLVDGQTSWVYPINPVQYLYISCYVTANKPVLSYLLLRLLPQVVYWYHLQFVINLVIYPCNAYGTKIDKYIFQNILC